MVDPQLEAEELLPVIDGRGNVIGAEKRGVIHARKLLHMAVHMMVFNPAGEVLLQLRVAEKDTWPLHWDTSVGGHVMLHETFEQTLKREMIEEMGLELPYRFVQALCPADWTGWEMIRQYVGWTDQTPQPDPQEVADWTFIPLPKLMEEIERNERPVTPSLRNFAEHLMLHPECLPDEIRKNKEQV